MGPNKRNKRTIDESGKSEGSSPPNKMAPRGSLDSHSPLPAIIT